MNKKVILIFFFAFLIRLIALNQSLWLDEATTAKVVRQYSYSGIIAKFSPSDFHPPLYYLLMKFWTNIFGFSETALRMPSVLFSVAAGYTVYLIAGIWGAVFFLFNPLVVYYSQEARMYMLATMFLTLSLYYFLKILNLKSKNSNPNPKSKILFGLFIGLSFLTFYGSVFLIAAFLVYFLYKKEYKAFFISSAFLLASFLIISPLFYQQFINARISLTNVTNWTYVLGKANIKNLLLIPVKFSIGRIDFYPKLLYYAIAGGWTVFVLSQIAKPISLFYYLFVFPLALGFVVSFATPLLQYFRFIYLVPVMAVLLAQKKNLKFFLAAGFIIFSLSYLLLPQFHREDWKGLVKNLPEDKPVYMIIPSSDPVKYYNKGFKIQDLRLMNKDEKEIFVIPYTADIYGFDYKKILQEKNYLLKGEKIFRGLILELYSRQ